MEIDIMVVICKILIVNLPNKNNRKEIEGMNLSVYAVEVYAHCNINEMNLIKTKQKNFPQFELCDL